MPRPIVRRATRYYAAPGAGVLFIAMGVIGGFLLLGLLFHPSSPLRWLLEVFFQ